MIFCFSYNDNVDSTIWTYLDPILSKVTIEVDGIFINLLSSDIDECASPETNQCDVNAECINIPGFYVCRCLTGYQGNGRTCIGESFLSSASYRKIYVREEYKTNRTFFRL